MPTYEYRCRDCGHSFDIVQKMSDEPLTHCPECGGTLRKVFAPPAISFKGPGFYATDHGKKAKSSSSEGDGKDKDAKDKDAKDKDAKDTKDTSDTKTGSASDTTKKDAKGTDSSSSSSSTTTKKEGPS
jgi:putative FmdB family regulatory protein